MDMMQGNDTSQPFQQALSLVLHEGDARATTDAFPVPSGKRLVIETISLLGLIPPQQTAFASGRSRRSPTTGTSCASTPSTSGGPTVPGRR